MPNRWLQIKGDPSVRKFLFQQTRNKSQFDDRITQLHEIITILLVEKGAFHVKAHYSSSQLTCWFYDDPFNYKVYLLDEVFTAEFLTQLPPLSYESRNVPISKEQLSIALNEFTNLRLSDEQIYLRSGSINRINGMISMNFSCDGSHYISHETFFQKLEESGSYE